MDEWKWGAWNAYQEALSALQDAALPPDDAIWIALSCLVMNCHLQFETDNPIALDLHTDAYVAGMRARRRSTTPLRLSLTYADIVEKATPMPGPFIWDLMAKLYARHPDLFDGRACFWALRRLQRSGHMQKTLRNFLRCHTEQHMLDSQLKEVFEESLSTMFVISPTHSVVPLVKSFKPKLVKFSMSAFGERCLSTAAVKSACATAIEFGALMKDRQDEL